MLPQLAHAVSRDGQAVLAAVRCEDEVVEACTGTR